MILTNGKRQQHTSDKSAETFKCEVVAHSCHLSMLRERKRYRKTGRQTDGLAGKQAETDRHSDFNSRDREMVRVRQTDIQTETDRQTFRLRQQRQRDGQSETDRHSD